MAQNTKLMFDFYRRLKTPGGRKNGFRYSSGITGNADIVTTKKQFSMLTTSFTIRGKPHGNTKIKTL